MNTLRTICRMDFGSLASRQPRHRGVFKARLCVKVGHLRFLLRIIHIGGDLKSPHEFAVTLLKTLSNEMAGKLVSADPHDYYGSSTFKIRP